MNSTSNDEEPLFSMDGLLDYRDTLGHSNGCDLIRIKLLARRGHELVDLDIFLTLTTVSAIALGLAQGGLREIPYC